MSDRKTIVQQYAAIRHAGIVNMFEKSSVIYYAHKAGLSELCIYLIDLPTGHYAAFLQSLTEEELAAPPDKATVEKLQDIHALAFYSF